MRKGLIVVGIWSAVLLLASLAIVGALGPIYSGSYYPFTLPFIVLAGTSVILSLCGLVATKIRTIIYWIAVPLHGLLYVPFHYAIRRWPGGDDGPGLAWAFLIGGGSCIAGLIAIVFVIVGVVVVVGKSKQTEQSA